MLQSARNKTGFPGATVGEGWTNSALSCPLGLRWYHKSPTIAASGPWTQTWALAVAQTQTAPWLSVIIKPPTDHSSVVSRLQICLYTQEMSHSVSLSPPYFAHHNSAHLSSTVTSVVSPQSPGQIAPGLHVGLFVPFRPVTS